MKDRSIWKSTRVWTSKFGIPLFGDFYVLHLLLVGVVIHLGRTRKCWHKDFTKVQKILFSGNFSLKNRVRLRLSTERKVGWGRVRLFKDDKFFWGADSGTGDQYCYGLNRWFHWVHLSFCFLLSRNSAEVNAVMCWNFTMPAFLIVKILAWEKFSQDSFTNAIFHFWTIS